MESNVFKPYKIIEQSETYLHLQETKLRRRFFYFFHRIYSLIMILAIVAILIIFQFPMKIFIMLSALGLLFIWILLLRNYVIEVEISTEKISISYQSILRKKNISFLIKDIESIKLDTYWLYNGGGFYYYIKVKNIRYSLFNIPLWYMNLQNRAEINQILGKITGLKVL